MPQRRTKGAIKLGAGFQVKIISKCYVNCHEVGHGRMKSDR